MPFVSLTCPQCHKRVTSVDSSEIFGEIWHDLSCGHHTSEKLVEQTDVYETFESLDFKKDKAFPFQIEAAKIAEKANIRVLFGHEQGLGKTIIELIVLRAHPEIQPCLVVCKSKLTDQYAYQIGRWIPGGERTQIITTGNDILIPDMKFYVIGFDMLRRFRRLRCKNCDSRVKPNGKTNSVKVCKKCNVAMEEYNRLPEMCKLVGIKSMIIDECQHIKNTESQRALELRDISKEIPHIMASSGSFVENHALEGFSVLNIIHPELFPSKQGFLTRWCDYYWNGYGYKVGGIRDVKAWRAFTEKFIIRKTRKEVMPEIPPVQRNYQYGTIDDDALGAAYVENLNDYIDYAQNTSDDHFTKSSNIMARMQIMKHLCGLGKVNMVVDYVDEFLENTDRKITIFAHHHDVEARLEMKLNVLMTDLGLNPVMMLTADKSAEDRLHMIEEFGRDPKHRVMIASTLSSGEGLDKMQQWSDCIMAEQQWNPMKEKQAEDRFSRIGQMAESVTAMYPILLGTIDEYLIELKERKRIAVHSTLEYENLDWGESSVIKELTETLIAKGKKKWNRNQIM